MAGLVLTHSDIGNSDGGRDSGVAFRGAGEIAFSKLHDVPEQILHGGRSIHDTEFYNNVESFLTDDGQHPNVAYWDMPDGDYIVYNAPVLFYNNYLHDLRGPGLPVIYVEAGFSTPLPPVRNIYIFNNLVVTTASAPFLPTNEGGLTGTVNLYVWGNTIETTYSAIFNPTQQDSGSFALLDLRNNHFIVDGTDVGGNNAPIINSITRANQRLESHSAASGVGYNLANLYSPSSSSSLTVNVGQDLSAYCTTAFAGAALCKDIAGNARSGTWDIGAYEYASGTNATINGFCGATNNLCSTGALNDIADNATHYRWQCMGINGGANASCYTLIPIISYPKVSNGTLLNVSQFGGIQFNITQPGIYKLVGIVNVVQTDGSANSFFVDIDTDPGNDPGGNGAGNGDASKIWDLAYPTSGFVNQNVSWRGANAATCFEQTCAQFNPKNWTLTAGMHTLYINEREAGTQVQSIRFVKINTTITTTITYHPADTSNDLTLDADEFTAYNRNFKLQESWPVPPSPPTADYYTRALYILKLGGNYNYNQSVACPLCWTIRT